MKKTLIVFGFLTALVISSLLRPVSTYAFSWKVPEVIKNKVQQVLPGWAKGWKIVRAWPGHPVTLEGEGGVKASGRGRIHYRLDSGETKFTGRGVIAVSGGEVQAQGFGKKKEVGNWTFYAGNGMLKVSGSAKITAWGKLRNTAEGKGKVTFRGWWNIHYKGVSESGSHIDNEVQLPEDLKTEAQGMETVE